MPLLRQKNLGFLFSGDFFLFFSFFFIFFCVVLFRFSFLFFLGCLNAAAQFTYSAAKNKQNTVKYTLNLIVISFFFRIFVLKSKQYVQNNRSRWA